MTRGRRQPASRGALVRRSNAPTHGPCRGFVASGRLPRAAARRAARGAVRRACGPARGEEPAAARRSRACGGRGAALHVGCCAARRSCARRSWVPWPAHTSHHLTVALAPMQSIRMQSNVQLTTKAKAESVGNSNSSSMGVGWCWCSFLVQLRRQFAVLCMRPRRSDCQGARRAVSVRFDGGRAGALLRRGCVGALLFFSREALIVGAAEGRRARSGGAGGHTGRGRLRAPPRAAARGPWLVAHGGARGGPGVEGGK